MPKLYHESGQWIVPGHQGKQATRHDIPANPAELANWLNLRGVASAPEDVDHDNDAPAEETTIPAAAPPPPPPTLDPAKIEQWLMDEASAAQVERIFTALGVRFHELRKAAHAS